MARWVKEAKSQMRAGSLQFYQHQQWHNHDLGETMGKPASSYTAGSSPCLAFTLQRLSRAFPLHPIPSGLVLSPFLAKLQMPHLLISGFAFRAAGYHQRVGKTLRLSQVLYNRFGTHSLLCQHNCPSPSGTIDFGICH